MSRGNVRIEAPDNDRELRLLALLCQCAFDESVADELRTSARGPVDRERLLRLARFHRVEALAWHGLRHTGWSAQDDWHCLSTEVTARNLAMISASAELQQALERAGLPFLFLKGLPLGVLAYGTPWLKSAIDIDLLADEARLEDTVGALKALGYCRTRGAPDTVEALREWHRFRKDSEWERPGSPARVDLHMRLTDNRALIPAIGIGSPRQTVQVTPDLALATLADDELFAHLCVHGASSAWFRLKWVTDLAAWLHPREPDEIERLYRRSQRLGAGRAAGQALLLADRVYGSLAGNARLGQELSADAATSWLYRSALAQLAGRREPAEPTGHFGGTLRIHLTQLLLRPGATFAASELIRQARAALR